MYKTLLVPLDGSGFSARALPVAVELARRSDATVHLAMVHDPSAFIPFVPGEVAVPVFDSDLLREKREESQVALNAAVASLTAQGVRAVGALLEGTVVESLVEYGQQVAAEMTLMTTHGRGGFTRFRLGSVATAYVVHATTPVLLVHGAGSDGEATPTLPSGQLLVPLDGSPFAEQIIPHAARFADACGMTLALISVVTPQAVSMAPFGMESLLADTAMLGQEEQLRSDYLTRIAAHCPAGTTVQCVTDMSPARTVLNATAHAGAVAMATHGRSGLKRLVLGSVTDEVIRHSTVPTLVYRSTTDG
jgi:nucleotide-binding universal stress UspA family protein